MLEIRNITLTLERDGEPVALLDDVSFNVPPGHLLAIVGPSGCGKTTLMKVIAGLKEEQGGEVCWDGRNLAHEGDLHPSELGYVPQFSVAHELLTVEECIASAIALRTRQPDEDATDLLISDTLAQTGLTPLADRLVKVLSGGQKRRLGLALELVTNPALLLCDEVTSGLDPKSEREITQLLHDLARQNEKRIVINVTHSLANLSLYDSILVLHEGCVVYHGPPRALTHYFSIDQAEDVYPKLARRSAARWALSWSRHRDDYYSAYKLSTKKAEEEKEPDIITDREPERIRLPVAKAEDDDSENQAAKKKAKEKEEEARKKEAEESAPHEISSDHQLPGFIAQTRELLQRRWLIFRRDMAQVWLHAAMLIGFPLLVVIFGYQGIKPLSKIPDRPDKDFAAEIAMRQSHEAELLKTGGLVSGLIMFQVVLVTLMASNNAAREIAGERVILERERLGGLRPMAYLTSKILFLGVFVLAQALWMGLFVEMVCHGIPGNLPWKLLLLVMASAAMTSVCLGISAMMRSPEKATILSIYLVGFQLPLSGAVLALPKAIAPIIQPFIAAFWSWSGSLHTLKEQAPEFFEAVKKVTASNIEQPALALFVLSLHVFIGLVFSYAGIKHSQTD
ncbi:MAG: ATP-binding cassette domain-containing protein [Verrucomicrobia bacterium]|nr:ATP-binding cassette domain-containing protein [Verrucomicrobiota bacterium]